MGGLAEIRSAILIKGCGVVLETMSETEREGYLEQGKDGGGVQWSVAGTNDGCAQGHTTTAVSLPNFSNVRSA